MNLGPPIDWAATGQMLTGLGTILSALAVVFAASRGVTKFDDWKTQRIEERRMDLAERILEAVYRFERAIGQVRGPLHLAGELEEAAANLRKDNGRFDEQPEVSQRRQMTVQVIHDRIQRLSNELSSLDQLLPLAKAVFPDAFSPLVNLRNAFFDLRWAADDFQRLRDGEDDVTITRIIFGSFGAKDEFNNNLNALKEEIEAILIPIIRHGND